jgi:putative flavoprotein involved in K+ transport
MYAPTPLLASNGRDIGLPALSRLGVRLLGRLRGIEGPCLTFEGDVGEYVEYADHVATDLERVADDYIAAAGLDAPAAEPDPGRGPLDVERRPTLDLDAAGIGSVVWSTGFGPDLSWLRLPVLGERGLPVLEDGGAVDLPSLRFVGMPWQSTRASAILHGMPLDVERAVAGVTAQLV